MAKAGKETALIQKCYRVSDVSSHMKVMPLGTDDWKVSEITLQEISVQEFSEVLPTSPIPQNRLSLGSSIQKAGNVTTSSNKNTHTFNLVHKNRRDSR